LQSYVNPHLPPALFKLAYPKDSSTVLTKLAPAGASIVSGTTLPTAQSSDVSLLTNPTLTTRTPGAKGSFQLNPNPDSTLQAIIPGNLRLKDVIGSDSPLLMDDNQVICLSYHMGTGCWSTCKRLATHHRSLNPAEKQRLATFALNQLAKRTPASGTGTVVPP
jgi:hypothetical protein